MKIEMMKIMDVVPYERNPRNNDAAVEAVANSIKTFGFKVPIVVDSEHVIVTGHTRLKAAKRLGLEEVPVIVASDLSPEQIKAYRIADNKTSELAEWNFDLLPLELRDLQSADFDLSLLGFDSNELDNLLNGEEVVTDGQTDADAVPEAPNVPKSQPGSVYRLGNHRLICGDATNPEHMKALLGDVTIDLYVVDPPYNVALVGSNGLTIANDNMPEEQFKSLLADAFKCANAVLKDGCSFYVFHSDSESVNFRLACREAGLDVHQTLYWVKNSFVLGRFDYHYQSESCLYGWKPGAAHRWFSDRCQCNLLKFDKPKLNADHPSMKPVEMLMYLIQNSSKRGDSVLDNFGGSGSTLIACERLGRVCYMVELDPRYCDVIRRRWAEFVHGEACDWETLTEAITT